MGMHQISSLFAFALFACCQCSNDTTRIHVFTTCAGRKKSPATPIEEVVTSSAIECARACKNNKYCRSANYIRDGTCQLLLENATCSQLPLDNNYEVIQPMSSLVRGHCLFGQFFNKRTQQCECDDGFSGEYCENPPRDCSDFSTSYGTKYIYLIGMNEKLSVRCGSWALHIMYLANDTSAFSDYMHSGWNVFKSGFNTYDSKQFWIGNDIVHKITNTGYNYKLETVAQIDNAAYYGRYLSFTMDDEAQNYTVHFTGTDNLYGQEKSFFDNAQFRAPDYNSNECTTTFGSAWWYPDNCTLPSLFTGNYPRDNQLKPMIALWLRLKRM